jgi:hypothetical protein
MSSSSIAPRKAALAGAIRQATGTVMMIVAHASSLLLVERLFSIVKPKLPLRPWFALP